MNIRMAFQCSWRPGNALSVPARFKATLVTFFVARFLLQDEGVLACRSRGMIATLC